MNRKYKLDTTECTSAVDATEIISQCCGISIDHAILYFQDDELDADPEHPRYRELIERLDSVGVKVYDMERVQIPKIEGVDHEQSSYT